MSVYKQKGSSCWSYRFMWRGQVIRESTKQTNKRVAEQMEAARKTALAKGEVGIRDLEPVPTLQTFADDKFLPNVRATKSEKPQTIRFYEGCVKNLKAFAKLAALPIDQITSEILGEYTAYRTAQGMKVSTINRDLATVRRMFKLAAEWRVTTVNLAQVKMNPGEESRMRVLTEAEESAYLTAARNVGATLETSYAEALEGIRARQRGERPIRPDSYLLHDITLLLADCGFRPEEVFRLRWPQVRDEGIHIERGKGKGSRRRVPCTPRVLAMLDMRRPVVDTADWIFPRPTKSGHAEDSSIRDHHVKALEMSSVQPFVIYDLRHTRITRWARVLPLPVVQRLAGHTEIKTTMRYVHVSDADVIEAMAKEQGAHRIGHSDKNEKDQPVKPLHN